MSNLDRKSTGLDGYLPPGEDEQGLTFERDWSQEEEGRAKRK